LRLARFSSLLNEVDSKILNFTPKLFSYWKILTKKYLKYKNNFKHNKLCLSHLRFLSNYYKFYNFRYFLAPLIDQVYYSLLDSKCFESNNLIQNIKLNDVINNNNIEYHFNDHLKDYSSIQQQHFTNFEINKTSTVNFILTKPKLSSLNFKNSKIFNLRLASLLLFALISSGNKKTALSIFNSLFELIKFKYQSGYLDKYTKFLMLLKPILRYRSMYIGGKKYKIPLLLTFDRGYSLATR